MLVDVGRKVPPQLQALLVPMSTVGQECLLTLHPKLLVAPPHTLQLHQRDVHAKVINLERGEERGGEGRRGRREGGRGRGEEGEKRITFGPSMSSVTLQRSVKY